MALLTSDQKERLMKALLGDYRENATYEDIEVEQGEDADDEEVSDEASKPDETPDTGDEVGSATEPTPEAAKQARVEMLKKFRAAVDAKLKLTSRM